MISRRNFIASGSGAAAALLAGCGQVRKDVESAIHWVCGGQPPLNGPIAPPTSSEIDEISHLINRLTFGPIPGEYARVAAIGPDAFIEEQLHPEKIDDSWCHRALAPFEAVNSSLDDFQLFGTGLKEHPGEMFDFQDKLLLDQLTRATITRAVFSRRQLYEVMVQFWTDHFNIDSSKGDSKWLKAWDDREVIRRHALGSFPAMLRASALSPAMLWYLDGRVNRRARDTDKPNENYARELMELHTLGVHGGYTQEDVQEVARCLTGWTVEGTGEGLNVLGKVKFKKNLHDDGPKTVLGHHIPAGLGEKDLDRVLEIVTQHPSTARYIATKLCRRFIDDEPPATAISTVADAFQRSSGDIRTTLRALFHCPEFRAARGNKFKRPFHYVVSALRVTYAHTDAAQPIQNTLSRMGHAPFRYPTPDGYPEDASHWDSTLLWRWNFAVALCANQLKGTQIVPQALLAAFGGQPMALAASMLGRRPSDVEAAAFEKTGHDLALILASPAFQRC